MTDLYMREEKNWGSENKPMEEDDGEMRVTFNP